MVLSFLSLYVLRLVNQARDELHRAVAAIQLVAQPVILEAQPAVPAELPDLAAQSVVLEAQPAVPAELPDLAAQSVVLEAQPAVPPELPKLAEPQLAAQLTTALEQNAALGLQPQILEHTKQYSFETLKSEHTLKSEQTLQSEQALLALESRPSVNNIFYDSTCSTSSASNLPAFPSMLSSLTEAGCSLKTATICSTELNVSPSLISGLEGYCDATSCAHSMHQQV